MTSGANRWRQIVFLLTICLAWTASAVPKTRIHLILSSETARAGDTVWAGLKMDMPPTWHVYWRYGGDAGDPVRITWKLPQGATAGAIQWPLPEKEIDKIGDSALVTYIYTHQVVLLTPIKLADNLPPGPVTIKASVHWMECSQECVMTEGDTSATLAIGDQAKPSADQSLISDWLKKVPPASTSIIAKAYWQSGVAESNSRPIVIEWNNGATPADFYPDGSSTNYSVDGPTETLPATGSNVVSLRKMVTKAGADWPAQLTGVLVSHSGTPQAQGFEVALDIQSSSTNAKKSAAPIEAGTLATMLLFAFLGGLILNVMPCVLPVIALKVFSFIKQSGEKPGRVRNLGFVYGIGVLVSFLILAGLAIGVQAAGGLANWGDLFRHPNVQMALTVLVTLIALNLFGLFEITLSSSATGAASDLASRPGFSGAFFNGVLATILATPCTAPFLGAALAFALAQSQVVIVLFFLTAGIGFAFPFVLLCAQPRWLGFLPKPGAWMEKFKIAMGFPMLATAFWLMWLSASDESSLLWTGLFLVVLALTAWIWGEFVQRAVHRKGVAAVVCAVLLVADYAFVLRGHTTKIEWQPWSQQAVEEAQKAGHPVLVDFTAKSCLTCQINKASSIEIDSTRAELRQIGAVALIGDYTREDPAIGEQLRHYDRSGVPLVLVYSKDPSKPPKVLPVILTPSVVLEALKNASS